MRTNDPKVIAAMADIFKRDYPRLSSGQRQGIIDAVLAKLSDAQRDNDAFGTLAADPDLLIHDIAAVIKADAKLGQEVPTPEAVVAFKSAEHEKIFGAPAPATKRVEWAFEAKRLSEDERLEIVSPDFKIETPSEQTPVAPLANPSAKISGETLATIEDRWGVPVSQLTAPQIKDRVKALEAEQNCPHHAEHQRTVNEITNVEAITGGLSPVQRIARARAEERLRNGGGAY